MSAQRPLSFRLDSLFLLCLLSTSGMTAGVGQWTSHGPEGTIQASLAVNPQNPSTVYAGTSGGVFRSTDRGGHWTWSSAGLGGLGAGAIAIDPAEPATAYVATAADVFKTTDGGRQWHAASFGLPGSGVGPLIVDPSAPLTLYAGTAGHGLFRSSDGAASWQLVVGGYFSVLAIDPSNSLTVYAATGFSPGTPLLKTSDGGANWTALPLPQGSQITALVVDPSRPATIYAGTVPLFRSNTGGLFRSTDGGSSWARIPIPTGDGAVLALALGPVFSETIYVSTGSGVLKSTDAGASWTPLAIGSSASVRELTAEPASSTVVYASADLDGIFRTSDGGASWSVVNNGLVATRVGALVIDSAKPARLFCGVDQGVYRSDDAGESWRTSGATPRGLTRLAVDPKDGSVIYAGTGSSGVFKSTDAGTSWIAINNGFPPGYSYALDIAPDPTAPSTLYASVGGTVFKTTNGGESWISASTGLEVPVRSLGIDPSNPKYLYAAIYSSPYDLYRSTDGATSWALIGKTPDLVNDFLFSSSGSPAIYIGTLSGVFRSEDGGVTWQPTGLKGSISGLVERAGALFASVRGTLGGVYRSTDGGQTWASLNDGLTNTDVTSLAADSRGCLLHAGTYGGGVFDLDLNCQSPILLPGQRRPPVRSVPAHR
jgi:photosystem II stability/assembly factor-like uncharacterized protein